MLFGSSMLEVGIGLAFLYLLLASICSAVSETVARIAGLRSSTLRTGIGQLLSDRDFTSIGTAFYGHPLVAALEREAGKLPSYIPARTFSLALLDLVIGDAPDLPTAKARIEAAANAATIPPSLATQLRVLSRRADNSLDAFYGNVEHWFDSQMDRVSGWYKRKASVIIFLLSVAVTVALNANTLSFASNLITNDSVREAFVAAAGASVSASPAPDASPLSPTSSATPGAGSVPISVAQAQADLSTTGLGLGWPQKLPSDLAGWVRAILGLAITAFAVSLGAPFWFDIVSQFVSLRETGLKPKPTD